MSGRVWYTQRKQVLLNCLISFSIAFGVNVDIPAARAEELNVDPERKRKRDEAFQNDLFSLNPTGD